MKYVIASDIHGSAYYCNKLIEVYNLSDLDIICGSLLNGGVGRYAKVIHTSKYEESIIKNIDGYQFSYFDNTYYLLGYIGEDTELMLPSSYNYKEMTISQYEIYKGAFDNNKALTSIKIPSSVTNIGSSAFSSSIPTNSS